MAPKKIKLVAKSVLINEQGKILILTRSSTDVVRPGELDLPGGGVDDGEDYRSAAIREIQEEIGVTLTSGDLRLVYTETSYFENLSTIRFLYAGLLNTSTAITLSYEHSDHEWLSLSEVEIRYNHPVWVKGLKYASDYGLLPQS